MDLSQIKHTVRLVTHVSTACPYCTEFQSGEKIDENINHLIQAHDGVLIQVGSETTENYKGETHHGTSAVVGFKTSPPPKTPVKFDIKSIGPAQ